MQIPGQTRLGQGFPGGAGALSPGVTGRVPGVPIFTSPPRVQAPPPGLGLPSYSPPSFGAAPRQSPLQQFAPTPGTTPSTKAYKLAEALQIVERIRRGWLSEKNAARMLKRFPVEIRRELADQLGTDSKDAVTMVHKLRIRPEDLGGGRRKKDEGGLRGFLSDEIRVSRNLAKDIETTVVGAVPQAIRSARALGADVADLASIARPTMRTGRTGGQEFEPLKETRKQVLDPMVEQYKYMYGPAMPGTPGGVGETLHRMGEHPLQPILDAAAVVSMGIGGTARTASALRAVKALPQAAKPMRRVTPREIEEHPYAVRAPVMKMPNGEIRVGEPGQGHDDLWTPEESRMLARLYEEDPDLADKVAFEQTAQGTIIFDPDTGKVARVNIGTEHPDSIHQEWPPEQGISVTHDRVPEPELDELQGPMLAAAKEHFEGRPGPTGREKFTAARRGFARPAHRGSLIEAYERMGGLALGERFGAARAAARGEVPGEEPPTAPPEGPSPESPIPPGEGPSPTPSPRDPDAPHPDTGIPQKFYEGPTPGDIENAPYLNNFRGFVNENDGDVILGPPGSGHDDILENQPRVDPDILEDPASGWRAFTGIIDPDTGKPTVVNLYEGSNFEEGGVTELTGPEWDALKAGVLAKANQDFVRRDELAGAERPGVDFSQALRRVDTDLEDLADYMTPEDIAGAREVIVKNLEESARKPANELADKLGPGFTIAPVVGRGQALDDLAGGPEGYTPAFDVSMETKGNTETPGFRVLPKRDGEGYEVWDTVEITDRDFFQDQADIDKYMDAVAKVQGHDPDEMLTLYRAMSETEKKIWDRGETIPVGKWLTSEETDQYAKDTMGEFPGLYKFQVRRGDVVEMTPGQFQLKGASRLDGDTIKAGGKGAKPSEAALRPELAEPTTPETWTDLGVAIKDFDREMREAEGRVGAQPVGPLGGEPPTGLPPTAAAPGEPAPEGVPPMEPTRGKLDLKAGVGAFFERRAAISHAAELKTIQDEILNTVGAEDLRVKRRTFKEVLNEVKADLTATRLQGKQRPQEMAAKLPGFISAGSTGRVLSMAETTLREASDLVRAGAIYLRPAYLPNNWASNFFMNAVSQGGLAPVNLAKALVVDKHIGQRYTRILDSAMGTTAAQVVTAARGRGYVGSLANPIAETMGKLADSPFRRSQLLHELRREGYSKLSEVKGLLDKVNNGDQRALDTLSEAARKAQEEIVKFGKYNEMESSILRNIVFVYSWMRGAGRYAGRFPMQHPIQAALAVHLGQEGKEWLNSQMGGVPSFLQGAIPVGRDKEGNPILINPFTLNPLGTGLDIARAAAGTFEVLRDPNEFNKYAEEDVVGLLNPLIQAYAEAREGGNPPASEAMRAIAPVRLQHELRHPGAGGVYPTSRKEAIGKYMFGTLFPRQADQAAITRSVEREQVGNRANLIPLQIKQYKKMTGQDLPEDMVTAYRRDLQMADDIRDFQRDYAKDHGSQGFRNMPPINRVKAAIEFHREFGVIDEQQLNRIEVELQTVKQDVVLNSLANGLWAATGVGSVKRTWDQMFKDAKGMQLTRERP